MKINFSLHIFEKVSNIKFQEKPSSGGRDVPWGWTDRRKDMANLTVFFFFVILWMCLKIQNTLKIIFSTQQTNLPKTEKHSRHSFLTFHTPHPLDTGWTTWVGLNSRKQQESSLFSKTYRPAAGANQPLFSGYRALSHPRGYSGRGAPFIAEVKNGWSFISIRHIRLHGS
jgi:hypothetical protein